MPDMGEDFTSSDLLNVSPLNPKSFLKKTLNRDRHTHTYMEED